MKAFTKRVDTVQEYYTVALDNTDEQQVRRTSQTRPTENHQLRCGAMLSSDVGGKPETSHGVVIYHKVNLKKKHRRNHSQRASGEKKKGTKGTRTARRTRRSGAM